MIKRAFRKLYYFAYKQFYLSRFKAYIYNQELVYIFDIDNTMSNTWPTLIDKHYSSEYKRLESLPAFIEMRHIVLSLINKKRKVLFLCARHYKYDEVTYKWLLSLGLDISEKQIFLVPNPNDKIFFLKEIGANTTVEYYDDLSYNHENNLILYYDNVISYTEKQKNIVYYNYSDIQSIIKGKK